MKNLNEYIAEGIFDIDDNIDNVDDSVRRDQIKQFLKDNFDGASSCKISRKPNANDKYEVSSTGSITVKNKKITSFTNGLFVWTTIGEDFYCDECSSLTSLEGAPKEVGGSFICDTCSSLISLKGAPEKVGWHFCCYSCKLLKSLEGAPEEINGYFDCRLCESLTSLKGAPKEVGEDFDCSYCVSLKSLKGAPKEVGYFDCNNCKSLTSLNGAPEKVYTNFCCSNCGKQFTEEDVKKVSNVKGRINIW